MSISRVLMNFGLSVALLLVGACSGITQSDKPAISKWWLEPYMSGPVESAGSPVGIAVLIRVVPGLDTDRILTLSNNAELGQFASMRWADHVPELVESLLSRSLQATGQFVVVPESAASGPGGCLLELEIREFFARVAANGTTTAVSISSYGGFQCKPGTTRVIQSEISVPVTEERMSFIIAAFQKGMDQMTREIINRIE